VKSDQVQKPAQRVFALRRAFGIRPLAVLLVIGAGVATGIGLTRQDGTAKTSDAKPAAKADGGKASTTTLEDVYSFGEKGGHPEWSVLRPVKDASGKVVNDPASGQPMLPRDTTPLRFGHAKHMSSPAVRKMLGEIRSGKSQSPTDTGRNIHIEFGTEESSKDSFEMACTFCHENDAAGRYMKPIKFAIHCADCHMEQIGIVSAVEGKDADGKKIGTLKVSKAVLNDEARADSYSPSQLPHGDSRALADIVDKQIGLWALASPPVVDKAKYDELQKAAGAAEEAPKPKSRRGSSAETPEAKPAEKVEEKPEEKQPPAGGGRRRSSEAAAPAAEAAGPKGPPAIGETFEDLKGVEKWRLKMRDKAMDDIRANCNYCHQPNAITDGPGADKALFVVSDQKIPEIWLPKSVFAHSSHSMVACVECHTLARPPAVKDGDDKSKTFFDWANKTERIMLPGIDSCRDCHAPVTKMGTSGAPHECVVCHTYHIKLPVSAQGKMTIESVLQGGKAAAVKPAPKPAPKPAAKPAAVPTAAPATGEPAKK